MSQFYSQEKSVPELFSFLSFQFTKGQNDLYIVALLQWFVYY